MEISAPLLVVSGMAFESAIAAQPGVQTLHGLNPRKLEDEMIQAIHRGALGFMSFGTAAGLDPALAPGTLVIARRVLSGEMVYTSDEPWIAPWVSALPGAVFADMVGVNVPITGVADKAQLFAEYGAAAADMESHHVARVAQRFGLPCAVLRVVLDPADCAVPEAALAATRENGTISYAKLLASLAKNPKQLPAMMKLGRHHAAAKRSLLHGCGLLGVGRFGLDRRLGL